MKNLILLYFFLFFYGQKLLAQTIPVPGESNENRYEEAGKIFGYPFTMFNRARPAWYTRNMMDLAQRNLAERLLKERVIFFAGTIPVPDKVYIAGTSFAG